MTRTSAALLAGVFALAPALSAQRTRPAQSADLIELDVVALDKNDQPVSTLRQEDFRIKEDGHSIEVKTFLHVTTRGSTEPDDARSVVVLMDDNGIPLSGTSPMKQIAQILLSPTRAGDEVAIVRLSSRTDEAFGDFATARGRIDGYHGGAVPYSRRDGVQAALTAIANISRQLEPVEHRRKVIICLGVRPICDVEEPASGGSSLAWPYWTDAIGAASRANVSVYAVDPTGLTANSGARLEGITRLTGGELFGNANNFIRAAENIWREASDYYLLGYWPSADRREIHKVEVSSDWKGVHLRARKRR